jgi:hypothetical protein
MWNLIREPKERSKVQDVWEYLNPTDRRSSALSKTYIVSGVMVSQLQRGEGLSMGRIL